MNQALKLVVAALAAVLIPSTAAAQGTPSPAQKPFGHGAFMKEMGQTILAPLAAPIPEPKFQPALKAPGDGPIVKREVLGYLPYWTISQGYQVQRWDLMTVLAWFAAEMNAQGTITAFHGWGGSTTAALVEEAHANGVKVIVTVTNFNDSQIDTLLQSPTNRANAIQSCLDLMATHNADGINIDFEFVPASAKQEFVTFMTDLKDAVAAVQPNGGEGHVSLAGPSVDWWGSYDYDQLLIHTDGIMVMAYGYHYGGGNPGPTAPLVGGGGLSNKSVTTTIEEYIQFGGIENRHKVMIGLPWYGREWRVADTSIPGTSLGGSGAIFFTKGEDEAANDSVEGTKQWHDLSKTAWYHINRSDGLYQVWYDDGESFHAKIDYVDQMDLGGVGIWALGYDGTIPDYWDAIETVLTDPVVEPDPDPEPEPEAAPELAPEAAPEPMPEAAPEPMPEVGPEPMPEAAPDQAPPAPDAVAEEAATGNGGVTNTYSQSGTSSFVENGSDGGCTGGAPLPWPFAMGLLMLAALFRGRDPR